MPELTEFNDISSEARLVGELLGDERLGRRKEGIRQAANLALLGRGCDRVAALQWLEEIAHRDPMLTVREAASQALAETRTLPVPESMAHTSRGDASRGPDLFRVRCPNGHVSQHDRREVCEPGRELLIRGLAGRRDKVLLYCDQCPEEILVEVDCEGYR